LADFPLVMQWNKRDVADALPVTVLEQVLNPSHAPSFEVVAITGRGVIESPRQGINAMLWRLEKL
ncbi:MAG: gliding-motility protein MglA, partial [Ktedonobacteraceae bacterium]|nr:gliding-motility protein MglA [Ktedonobacteraceae bacterium]